MDAETMDLAESQMGLVAAWQLAELGWTRSAVRWAVQQRRLQTFCPGVFAVGSRPASREARWLGAVLAIGPDAVLSHHPAGVLWGVTPAAGRPHVTTTRGTKHRPGVVVHESRVSGADRTVRDGVPVTALPRTLLDLAEVLDPERLVQAIEGVRHLDVRAMRRCLARHPGRHGARPLRRVLDAYDPETRSILERAFLRLCRDHGVPRPLVNRVLVGAERDFAWPDVRLVVEVDGAAFHAPRAKRNDDSRRDVDLGIAGWRVHRLTTERVMLDPAGTAAAVLALRAAAR
jgi:very-short-patch-repair endonuclease